MTRSLAVLFILLPYFAARAADLPPIEVVIIGVPSTGVLAYRDSLLGTEAVRVCSEIENFFKGRAHLIKLCTKEETTFEHVDNALLTYFQGNHRRRVTLVFLMTHGEPTQNDDVRLLMSDTTDDTLLTHSLLLRQQLGSMLVSAADSVAIAFVDACFSGRASSYRLTSLGRAAEKEGVHAGLLASAQAYQQSFELSFTKALIDTWSADCPKNPDDFISAVLDRMKPEGSSPLWLMTYHGSLCFGELLAPDKRVMSIWRDPHKQVRISLFDEKSNNPKPLRVIPPGEDYVMPYVQALVPGIYRVETHDEEHQQALLDKSYCDFSTEPYCEYTYPAQPDGLTSFSLEVASYEGALALGYSDEQLRPIVARSTALYARMGLEGDKRAAARLIESSPQLASAILETGAIDLAPGAPRVASGQEGFWGHLNPFARKKYVERQAIRERVNELDELTAANSKVIKDVDSRAEEGVRLASSKGNEADQHAIEAGNRAQAAQQTAQQATSRIQTIEQVVANIDQYQPSAETEICFRPGQTVLSEKAKDALNEMTSPLKNQRGYIIEVQGFSSGHGHAAVTNSQKMADSVVRYLVLNEEVPVYRIYVIGMGNAPAQAAPAREGEPMCPVGDRVEIKLLKTALAGLSN